MYFNLAVTMMIVGFALFLAYIAVLIYSNSLIGSVDRNHFRNSFPYNFYMSASIPLRASMYILLCLSTLATAVGESLFFLSFDTTFMVVAAILMPLSLILLTIANILPLSSYRLHLIFSGAGFFVFAASASVIPFSIVIPYALAFTNDLSLGIAIPLGIMGILSLLSLINPKLANWFKMEKTERDGTTYYVKPKYNFYAMYEWIFLIESHIAAFLFILNIIVTNAIELA
ncbi:MAG: hypothetical protein K5762_02645 [Bacilli bacterium]|jgi:hypothetical protein|nr:hypothetical protein [Bacilli bacterium]